MSEVNDKIMTRLSPIEPVNNCDVYFPRVQIEGQNSHQPHFGDRDEDIFDVEWPEVEVEQPQTEAVCRPCGDVTCIIDEQGLVSAGYLESRKVKFGLQKLLSQRNRSPTDVKKFL